MQSKPTRRQRRHPNQINAILDSFRSSGLDSKSFCRQHGLNYSTLRVWLNKFPPAPTIPLFVEVALPSVLRSREPSDPFRIEFPSGIRLLISPGFDPAEALKILQLLSPA